MTSSILDAAPVSEIESVTPQQFADDVAQRYQPVVMRGVANAWPAVQAGRSGPRGMADYLLHFDRGAPADVMMGAPEINGRFFYSDDLRGFNFHRAQVALPVLLAELIRQADELQPNALYAGAASAPDKFPGWSDANPLPFATPDATPRVWLGNNTRASTHYDVSSNIAVVVAGRRRFALFPPEQAANLYVGPLDMTIAGQPVSMVDLEAPDLRRYPRFATAQETMQVAWLEPGDAIFIPSLWWHDVRAEGPLNVLVNYWWGQETVSPFPALVHAMLSVRDLPAEQRAAVRRWFDAFVFADQAADAGSHLPPHARGPLGSPSPEREDAIRTFLIRTLQRSG